MSENIAQSVFLGIDGGGTRCRALLCDSSGEELGKGLSGAGNVSSARREAIENIASAAEQAIKQAGIESGGIESIPAFLGLAGVNIVGKEDVKRLEEDLPFSRCVVDTDARTGLQGALGDKDGALAALGTGSVWIHRRNGKIRPLGGWGFHAGDFGSGAWIGQELLKRTLLARDGMREASEVTRKMMKHFDNQAPLMADFAEKAKPKDFADFAPLVFEFAGKGDPTALSIRKQAVSDVEETLSVIFDENAGENEPLCLLGGLSRHYAPLLDESYRRRLVEAESDSVHGAAQLAIQRFGNA